MTPEKAIEELIAALARLRAGDLDVSVSFAGESGPVGRLGREFNQTVLALRENNGGKKRVSRLVHDIKNPLAGIAGVLEIIGEDLPQSSAAREVLPEVKQEIEKIKQLLAEFAQGQ